MGVGARAAAFVIVATSAACGLSVTGASTEVSPTSELEAGSAPTVDGAVDPTPGADATASDASPDAESGVDASADGGAVRCGVVSCVAGQVCCLTTRTCAPAGSCGASGPELSCDADDDCGGKICCSQENAGGQVQSVACKGGTSCSSNGHRLCVLGVTTCPGLPCALAVTGTLAGYYVCP